MKINILAIALLLLAAPALADNNGKEAAAFKLPALTYEYNALAPAISEDTMRTHHTKHHQAYVDKLNAEITKTPELQGETLEEILSHVSRYSDAVRNNAGGHWNHSFFWKLMAAEGQRGEISPVLKSALDAQFGSVEKFKAAFNEAGASRFGSGWVWLVADNDGKLAITSTANQDNPLMEGAKVAGVPILSNDVWEHSYYLDYKNKRADYLGKWWSVVNWSQVSSNFSNVDKK